MKQIVIMCLIALGLSSCATVDRVVPWSGDKEIPAEGGTVVWKPNVKKPNLYPTIDVIYLVLYNSAGECVDGTVLDMKTQKIKDGNSERVKGEWYEVTASQNAISITFSPNDTQFTRATQITFVDGYSGMPLPIEVSQQPMISIDD